MDSAFNEKVLNSLGYGNRKVHLITFDNDVRYSSITKTELKIQNLSLVEKHIVPNLMKF